MTHCECGHKMHEGRCIQYRCKCAEGKLAEPTGVFQPIGANREDRYQQYPINDFSSSTLEHVAIGLGLADGGTVATQFTGGRQARIYRKWGMGYRQVARAWLDD